VTRAVFAAALLLVSSSEAAARTWIVGGAGADFPLITPAIAAAADGDVIVVGPGVYRENLLLDRRVSIVGRGSPVLYGTGIGSVIRVAAPGCTIEGLTIEGSGAGESNEMDAAIQITSSGTRIARNTMRRVFYGVVIGGGADNEIDDNAITGFLDLPFGRRGDGIYVYRASGTRVRRNRITGQRDGIYFQYAPGGLAEGNVVSASRYGLHVMFSHGIVIRDNTLRQSSVGANVMDSRRIEIEGNRFERNRGVSAVGLTLKQCDDSTVRANTFVDNARGLQVDGSSRNRFTGNRFLYNDTALLLFASAEHNVLATNVFDGNWSDVVMTGRGGATAWSDAGRGNAWSGYRGFDFDGDGIGEAPHPLLTPYAAVEGANPIARLFLQSPAAAGLALAAHAGLGPGPAERDTRPLAAAPSPSVPASDGSTRDAASASALAAATVGLLLALAREVSPC
jgi:nitrous oxidase accessory protein